MPKMILRFVRSIKRRPSESHMSELHVLRLDCSFVTECHRVLASLTDQKNVDPEKSQELVESVEILLNHGGALLDEKRRQQASFPFPESLSP